MTNRYPGIFLVLLVLLQAGCAYRFVDLSRPSGYDLVSVRNTTAEAGLARMLEEEMRRNGGFRESSAERLSVTVSGFNESVESVSSSGSPVRQKLTMEVAWKVEGSKSAKVTFGKKVVTRSYPYSKDTSTLDWNRSAAVRLLTGLAARSVLEGLGRQP